MPRTIAAVRGFTLVELVTTIVIMGILSAVIAPKFFDHKVFSERGYIDEVAAALRYANSVAVSSGCEVEVTFNAVGYQASQHVNGPPACSGAWSVSVIRVDGSALSGVQPSDVSPIPDTQIIFDAQGTVVGGVPPVIAVGSFTLTIDANSGLVVRQ